MDIRKGLAMGFFSAALLGFAPNHAAAENMNPELLGATCVVCHGQGGHSQGHIPAIDAMSADKIATTMREFRDGKRANTIMGKIAKGFSDAQIDLVASHFGAK